MQIVAPSAFAEALVEFNKVGAFCAREYGLPRAPHISTTHRWRLSGVRGHVLATTMIGGRRYVRPADLRHFIVAINEV